MRPISVFAAFSLLCLAAPTPVLGQRMADSYCTFIGNNDKYASDGYPLTDAGAILQQDRANVHRFGLPDRGDESDRSFRSTRARSAIPGMLARGSTPRSVRRAIERGNPYVCVEVYRNAIDVYLN